MCNLCKYNNGEYKSLCLDCKKEKVITIESKTLIITYDDEVDTVKNEKEFPHEIAIIILFLTGVCLQLAGLLLFLFTHL